MPQPRSRVLSTFVLFALLLTTPLSALAALRAQEATPIAGGAASAPVLLMAAPGMSADMVTTFAAEGALPAFAALLAEGASAEGGLASPFPATPGTGLATLLTGTWPGQHGVVNEVFYRTGSPDFAESVMWDAPGLIQADTLPQAAERAGKTVVAIDWPGVSGLDPAIDGPVVSAPLAFSQPGVLVNYDLPVDPDLAADAGVSYDRVELRAAEGWTDAPESFSPAQETDLTLRSLDAAGPNPDRAYAVYIYDASDDETINYDRVLLAPEKDAAQAVADLGAGAWDDVPVALSGDQAGEAAGFWLKAIDLEPDLSRFRLYATPVSRIVATWNGCGERPECTAPGGFAEAVNAAIGAPIVVDAAPLTAGVIDEATFIAQGITGAWQAVDALRFVVSDLAIQPDLLLLGTDFPGQAARQFPAVAVASGEATPVAEGVATGEELRLSFLRESYQMADQLLSVGRDLLGPTATTLAVATGGGAASWLAVDAGQVLRDAGLAEAAQPANCVPAPVTAPPGTPDPEALPVGPAVKACWDGGTAQISINLDGREAAGTVAEDDYEPTRDAVVAAFEALADPANPEADVVAGIFRKEELRDVAGADALHPSRSGDVVVTLNPPYRFAATGDAPIAAAHPLQATGYLPDAAEAGFLLAAGPAIATGGAAPARAIDVAPTAAFLLRVPGPYNASGSILFALLAAGPALGEVTFLDISDFHGQLTPLNGAADNIDAEGAVNSTYSLGGVAVLGPWFDRFRADARGEAIVVAGGDSVGASPPISSVFADLPTIEAMNELGFTADALGNHNFDAGAAHMFGTLAPAANFPYLSVNLAPARADATPQPGAAPFQPSLSLEVDGVNVGIVGFSNPDIPLLTRPGATDPYRVIDPAPAVNAEAARLRAAGAEVVVALGHMGATEGTLTDPRGPGVAMADQLQGVDVVIADHTDMQVLSVRPNGVLLVENRSKGVMFNRVRIVVDRDSGELIYRTADFHRPWTIGITPDPEIVAGLDRLQAELAPVLGEVIGSATRDIPRADTCGMDTGRTCESLVGDIITDAMRLTYGAEFAITNSGGIRADLTCPPEEDDFCPPDAGPRAITKGQVLTVLPFGNIAVTVDVSGAELKEMLETGVAAMPEPSGAFPQVSGLCFTYDIAAAPGSRITGAVRQAADGSCTGEAIDFSDEVTYTIVTNDFTAAGGDGYPDIASRSNTRDILADVVTAYIAGESPLSLPGEPLDPQREGRIECVGEACPVFVAE